MGAAAPCPFIILIILLETQINHLETENSPTLTERTSLLDTRGTPFAPFSPLCPLALYPYKPLNTHLRDPTNLWELVKGTRCQNTTTVAYSPHQRKGHVITAELLPRDLKGHYITAELLLSPICSCTLIRARAVARAAETPAARSRVQTFGPAGMRTASPLARASSAGSLVPERCTPRAGDALRAREPAPDAAISPRIAAVVSAWPDVPPTC